MSEPAYLIDGRRLNPQSPGFTDAIAAVYGPHAAARRPRCLCRGDDAGIEMYVARLGDGYIVKRMPGTGSRHASECPSYEPPPDVSGLGQVLGSAIVEDPATGETALKLDFALSRFAGRSTMPSAGEPGDSVATHGPRLSLRAVLHYLWDQAGLTRWQPGFAGKRNWAVVRARLLQAAQQKIASGGCSLASRLYVPEPFAVDRRDEIDARRLAQWAQAMTPSGKARPLMLLIGEVKEIVPARYGFKAVVKHLPDRAFALDALLYRRLGRRFERELSLWGSSDSLHMMLIATFAVDEAGIATIAEVSLMPVTLQWLPVEDAYEQKLVERLVHEERSFIKGLRYNLPVAHATACATLVEANMAPIALWIERGEPQSPRGGRDQLGLDADSAWVWQVSQGAMPALPVPRLIHASGGPQSRRAAVDPGNMPTGSIGHVMTSAHGLVGQLRNHRLGS